MTLTATDILELQYKVNQLDGECSVVKNDKGYVFYIKYYEPEYGATNDSVFITHDNESTWEGYSNNYETMMNILDHELEKKEERDSRERKRVALIKSLTPEQRELLGLQV